MQRYAERHGYSLQARADYYIDDPSRIMSLDFGDRCKVRLYKELYPHFDAVLWLDIDTLVMNPEVRVEDVLGDRPFLWSYDVTGPNTGAYISRCIPDVAMFLHQSIHYGTEHIKGDVTAMREVGWYPPHSRIAQHAISGKEFGHCFLYAEYGWSPQWDYVGNYGPGDWLLTFPAKALHERLDSMKFWAGKAT